MKRLTERDDFWIGEEFWLSAKEPDDDEIEAVYMKLREYENLEEDKKLFSLPAAIGSKLYTCILGDIVDYTIVGYSIDETGVWLASLEFEANGKVYSRTVETSKIGETWFFSVEEVKMMSMAAALTYMENQNKIL